MESIHELRFAPTHFHGGAELRESRNPALVLVRHTTQKAMIAAVLLEFHKKRPTKLYVGSTNNPDRRRGEHAADYHGTMHSAPTRNMKRAENSLLRSHCGVLDKCFNHDEVSKRPDGEEGSVYVIV